MTEEEKKAISICICPVCGGVCPDELLFCSENCLNRYYDEAGEYYSKQEKNLFQNHLQSAFDDLLKILKK